MSEDLEPDPPEAPGRLLVEPGGACPVDALGRPRSLFRPGDVLRVSCPLRETEVVSSDPSHVCLRWPWRWPPDVEARLERLERAARIDVGPWRGQLCFDRDRRHPDAGWLFRFDPDLSVLVDGDHCRVGIPPTTVHALEVSSWCLPRPWSGYPSAGLAVHVLPRGVPHDRGRDDLLYLVNPYGQEPIRVELLFRPYPDLRDLDMVVDRRGRRWVFLAPWWWVVPDHDDAREGLPASTAGPEWPLTLVADRDGDAPPPERAARVARMTAEGDHASHLAAWSRLAGAEPSGLEHQSMPGPDGHEPLRDRERVAADTRTDLLGMTFTQILCAMAHSCARDRAIGAHADELEVSSLRRRLQVRVAVMASALRQLRATSQPTFNG